MGESPVLLPTKESQLKYSEVSVERGILIAKLLTLEGWILIFAPSVLISL